MLHQPSDVSWRIKIGKSQTDLEIRFLALYAVECLIKTLERLR